MTNRKFLSLLLALLSTFPCFAQSPEEIERQMDEIKMDESYIYGEDYSDDKDMAYQNALVELLSSINELRGEKGKEYLTVGDIQTIVKELRYTKGTRNVAFLYLPLDRAMTLSAKQKIDVAGAGTSSRRSGNAAAQTSGRQQAEPAKPAPNPASTVKPKPTPAQADNASSKPAATSTLSGAKSFAPADKSVLETLCGQDNWVEIKGFLSSFKKEGKIRETGRCLSPSEVPDDAYSILMDEMGGILAIMSPKNLPNRLNHKTNQTDNENNHANCKFIVWYK